MGDHYDTRIVATKPIKPTATVTNPSLDNYTTMRDSRLVHQGRPFCLEEPACLPRKTFFLLQNSKNVNFSNKLFNQKFQRFRVPADGTNTQTDITTYRLNLPANIALTLNQFLGLKSSEIWDVFLAGNLQLKHFFELESAKVPTISSHGYVLHPLCVEGI